MRSVVIRMNIDEMPTACGPCELSCTAICKEWTKVDRKEIGRTKSPNCPILAILPEGHGRLVDADAMEEDLDFDVENDQRALDDMDIVGYERTRLQFDKDCKKKIMWYLSEAPTIVPSTAERSET